MEVPGQSLGQASSMRIDQKSKFCKCACVMCQVYGNMTSSIFMFFRRFHYSLTNHNRWMRERSHESYAKNYSVVFPYDEPLAGRNMRKDPLYEVKKRKCTKNIYWFWACNLYLQKVPNMFCCNGY